MRWQQCLLASIGRRPSPCLPAQLVVQARPKDFAAPPELHHTCKTQEQEQEQQYGCYYCFVKSGRGSHICGGLFLKKKLRRRQTHSCVQVYLCANLATVAVVAVYMFDLRRSQSKRSGLINIVAVRSAIKYTVVTVDKVGKEDIASSHHPRAIKQTPPPKNKKTRARARAHP